MASCEPSVVCNGKKCDESRVIAYNIVEMEPCDMMH